jgi:carbon starvation protein CstA
MLSASTLLAASVWLLKGGKGLRSLIALVPAMFMVAVVVSFIFWTSPDKGQPWGLVPGGMRLEWAIALGMAFAVAAAAFAYARSRNGDGGTES